MKTRTEKDSLGEWEVPEDRYYGIHTARSMKNFQISSLSLPKEQVRALAFLKLSCAKANMELGLLSKEIGDAIAATAREIINGRFDDHFVVDIFQAGSGTSSNMNINEVIAGRSNESLCGRRGGRTPVHPNDHVNMGQSTNNVFPSSIRVASVPLIHKLIAEIKSFNSCLIDKQKEFDAIVKSGRTHLQDAVPIRLGQVFQAFAASIEKDEKRIASTLSHITELGIGGNAVGTGINTPVDFRKKIISYLNRETGCKFKIARNGIEATNSTTDIAEVGCALKILAININRICNDLRLMNSGPNGGLDEINLPPVEAGSSIMPGKVNPSICEAVNMVCYRVIGNVATIESCVAAAQLELNTTMPITGYTLIESLNIMTRGIRTLREKCLSGITANKEQCREYMEQSPSLATFLNPLIGYDRAAEVVKKAIREKKTIPQIILENDLLTAEQIKDLFDPQKLTSPYE